MAVNSNIRLQKGTDKSGSITLGGTAQTLAVANELRIGLFIQNISAEDMWVNETGGTAAIAGTGSYKIVSFGTFYVNTNKAISVVAATTGSKWTATEVQQ
jgi:hypothetical protein